MSSIDRYLLSLIIVATLFNSCTGQNKKPEYNPKAIELNEKAGEYAQNFKIDSALYFYNKAIDLDKTFYLPHSNKINIYVRRKQFDKAISESEMVIKKKPDLAEGWLFTGALYDRQGDTPEANKYYKKSIEIFTHRIANPEKADMISENRFNRAFAYILFGQNYKRKK